MLYHDLIEAIGNTPLVELPRSSPNPRVRLYAKLEGQNPTGSVKDRIAKYMIEDAERTGVLTKERIVLEPTAPSGAVFDSARPRQAGQPEARRRPRRR